MISDKVLYNNNGTNCAEALFTMAASNKTMELSVTDKVCNNNMKLSKVLGSVLGSVLWNVLFDNIFPTGLTKDFNAIAR